MTMNHGASDAAFILSEYETWLRSWASDRTTEARVDLARSRLRAWGLEGMTARNVVGFLSNPNFKKWTRATYHSHLTDFCKWLVASHYLAENPMLDVKSVKRPRPNPRPISEDEATRVLATATGRTRDWILLAMLAGLRASEIARVRGEDVNLDGIYVMGKGEMEATLPCHPDLWTMAQRYPRSGYWFPGNIDGHVSSQQISMVVGRLFRSLGVAGSVHRCRHLFATRLLRSGVHVRRVQKLMRHAALETTASYTAVDEDELRAAINLLGPVA